jgi:predicted amidophosphoribosyltransferase
MWHLKAQKANLMNCPKCHAENLEEPVYCRKCGQPLDSELVRLMMLDSGTQ